VEPREAAGETVRLLFQEEAKKGIDQVGYYLDFADRVQKIKRSLMDLL